MGFRLLKQRAKEKLKGIYINAVLGQLVCYIPSYLLSTVTLLIGMQNGGMSAVFGIGLISEILVLDIFLVGYIRSLLDANDCPETDEKRYDINIVLSGFSKNYKNTLKTMFLRRLYLFGWGFLMLLPMIIAVGVIGVLSVRPEVTQAINLATQLMQSPTPVMLVNVNEYIANNCDYIIYILGGASLLSLILMIPYVRKTYLYEMIPMIVAENPDMPSDEAFTKTKEIMHGYRMKYFWLEMSFLGIMILISLVSELIPLTVAMYIAMAVAMPYMNMTFVQFYLARTRIEATEDVAERDN